jgi:FkbM family methyltransferase
MFRRFKAYVRRLRFGSREPARYYSQFGEDKLLDRVLTDPAAYCVDVGANDGASGSNTRRFVDKGLHAVLIEPDPRAHAALQRLHQYRSTVQIINSAVGAADGETRLFLPRTNTQLTSCRPAGAPYPDAFEDGEQITVPLEKLDTILERHAPQLPFALLSIDVEGTEYEVLQGFSVTRWAPRVVVIETHYEPIGYQTANLQQIHEYMMAASYRPCRRTESNTIFASNARDARAIHEA